MSCEKWGPLLAAEYYGDNSDADRATLAQHLSSCASCRATLEGWRGIVARPPDAAAARSDAFWIRQKASILERLPKQSSGGWPVRGRWLAPVLALGLVISAGWGLHRQTVRRDLPIAQNMEMLQNMDMLAHLDVLEAMDQTEVQ